jgi:hypothetical protein
METLPAVLLKEAPPLLRQILEAVESQLLARLNDDLASGHSLLKLASSQITTEGSQS